MFTAVENDHPPVRVISSLLGTSQISDCSLWWSKYLYCIATVFVFAYLSVQKSLVIVSIELVCYLCTIMAGTFSDPHFNINNALDDLDGDKSCDMCT